MNEKEKLDILLSGITIVALVALVVGVAWLYINGDCETWLQFPTGNIPGRCLNILK